MALNLTLGDTKLIIDEAKKKSLLRNELAYVLATAYHETAHTMKPVREYGGETYLKKKKYYPYVGMGYVQLTWKFNYERASKELGVDFVTSPKLLLEPKYAVQILIKGMVEGWFSSDKVGPHKLSRYFTLKSSDYVNARRMINGTDKAALLAEHAEEYEKLLIASGYGVETPVVVVPEPIQEPVQPVPTEGAVETPKTSPSLLETILRLIRIFTK